MLISFQIGWKSATGRGNCSGGVLQGASSHCVCETSCTALLTSESGLMCVCFCLCVSCLFTCKLLWVVAEQMLYNLVRKHGFALKLTCCLFSELWIKIYAFLLRSDIWKCCPQNDGHFFQASICELLSFAVITSPIWYDIDSSDAGDGIFRLWGSIPCLLMHWLQKSPVHQQAWYWPCRTNNMCCYSRLNFKPNPRYNSKCEYIFCNI